MDGRVVYDYQISSLEGRLLTLVETIGLHEKQEEAVKDMLRGILRTALFIETEYVGGDQLNKAIQEYRNGKKGTPTGGVLVDL